MCSAKCLVLSRFSHLCRQILAYFWTRTEISRFSMFLWEPCVWWSPLIIIILISINESRVTINFWRPFLIYNWKNVCFFIMCFTEVFRSYYQKATNVPGGMLRCSSMYCSKGRGQYSDNGIDTVLHSLMEFCHAKPTHTKILCVINYNSH